MTSSPWTRRLPRTLLVALVLGWAVACTPAPDEGPEGTPGDATEGSSPRAGDDAAGHRDWLMPPRTLRIGQHRYVSACQLLTAADLEERVLSLPDTFQVVEEYLDRSLPHRQFAADEIRIGAPTSCEYLFDWYDRPFVGLEVVHGVSADGIGLELPRAGEARRELAAMRRVVGEQPDESTAGLVARMSEGLQRLRRAEAPLRKAEGLVTAYDPVADGFGVLTIRGPLVVKLYYGTPGKPMGDSERAIAVGDLAHYLDRVLERLGDPDLPQSPAPTVLGESRRLGSTPLIEACHVLDDGAFEVALGVPPNGTVRRQTYPRTPVLTARSACTRSYGASQVRRGRILPAARSLGDGGYATASLELVAYPDRKALMADWRKLRSDPTGVTRVVRTGADGAFVSRVLDGAPPLAFFRVGPYSAVASLDLVQVRGFLGDQVTLPQRDAQLVRLVNRVSARIRADLAAVRGRR